MSRPKIVVDTNLLLPLAIGSAEPSWLQAHPRTRNVSLRTLEMIKEATANAEVTLAIPVVVEVDHFLRKPEWMRRRVLESLRKKLVRGHVYRPSPIRYGEFEPHEVERYGVADITLAIAADDGFRVLTNDGPLLGFIISRGGQVYNPLL